MPSPLSSHPLGAPGSPQAVSNGCECPVLDNRHGAGLYTDTDGSIAYAVNHNCPIHCNYANCMPLFEA